MMGPGITMLASLGYEILFLVRVRDLRTVSLVNSWDVSLVMTYNWRQGQKVGDDMTRGEPTS